MRLKIHSGESTQHGVVASFMWPEHWGKLAVPCEIEGEIGVIRPKAPAVDTDTWNYDMAALPTSQMVEVAFDGSLGMCNVQVCQKVSWSEKANRADEYHREGSEADLSRGWRPYAWRHIPIPPPRKP